MSDPGTEKLIYMANQIGAFFASQPDAARAAKVADHLKAYWAPPMRQAIRAHLAEGGEGLSPIVREAVTMLGAPPGETRAALARADESTARAPGDDAG